MMEYIDNPALQALGWPKAGTLQQLRWQTLLTQYPLAYPGRVIAQHRDCYQVATATQFSMQAQAPSAWRQPHYRAQKRATTGDWVLLEGTQIVSLLPRYTALCRAAAGEHYQQQVIAANIDTVFILCGLDGDFNLRRIERYLLLLSQSGITPVIVLTKADQCEKATALAQTVSAELGVAAHAVNTLDSRSVSVLEPWLQPGMSVALVGSSGAGKSSLCNTLLGEVRMKTARVRQRDARGRHTTTHRALWLLPTGACLIDTPGMRELKPTGDEALENGGFADIEALAQRCRFTDCTHHNEPGCAVRAALESGELSVDHLHHYLKLQQEVTTARSRYTAQLKGSPGRNIRNRKNSARRF